MRPFPRAARVIAAAATFAHLSISTTIGIESIHHGTPDSTANITPPTRVSQMSTDMLVPDPPSTTSLCHWSSAYLPAGRYIYGQRFSNGDTYDNENLVLPDGTYTLNNCLTAFDGNYLVITWLEPTSTPGASIMNMREAPPDSRPIQWGSFLLPAV